MLPWVIHFLMFHLLQNETPGRACPICNNDNCEGRWKGVFIPSHTAQSHMENQRHCIFVVYAQWNGLTVGGYKYIYLISQCSDFHMIKHTFINLWTNIRVLILLSHQFEPIGWLCKTGWFSIWLTDFTGRRGVEFAYNHVWTITMW